MKNKGNILKKLNDLKLDLIYVSNQPINITTYCWLDEPTLCEIYLLGFY